MKTFTIDFQHVTIENGTFYVTAPNKAKATEIAQYILDQGGFEDYDSTVEDTGPEITDVYETNDENAQ